MSWSKRHNLSRSRSPRPLLGSGYQGRRGSDTLPPPGPNSDPRYALQGSRIAPSARAGAKRARSSRARPCRCQRGTAGSFFLREHAGAELTPSVRMAKRGVNCRAWDRRLIACRSAILWLICDGSQAPSRCLTATLPNLAWEYGRLAFACGRRIARSLGGSRALSARERCRYDAAIRLTACARALVFKIACSRLS